MPPDAPNSDSAIDNIIAETQKELDGFTDTIVRIETLKARLKQLQLVKAPPPKRQYSRKPKPPVPTEPPTEPPVQDA